MSETKVELEEHQKTTLELAQLSLKSETKEEHNRIWKAFHLGIKYQEQVREYLDDQNRR